MQYIICDKCGNRIPVSKIMKKWASKGGSVSSEAKKQAALKREAKKREIRNHL